MRTRLGLSDWGAAILVLATTTSCAGDEFSADDSSGRGGTAAAGSADVAGAAGGSGVDVPPNCGDGVVALDEGEECDDGNRVDGDRCSAACQLEAASTCGDGVLDLRLDEQCDDGNQGPNDGCSPACQLEEVGQQCGDGSQDGLEVCDDGNTQNGDGCNPTCNLQNTTTTFVGAVGQSGFADDPSGTGAARIGGLGTLAADDRHLYLADSSNHRVRRITVATRAITTIAGNGSAGLLDATNGTNASFEGIESIATDGRRLWVGDEVNCLIREIDLAPPHAVTTVAGNGSCNHNIDGVGTSAEFMGIRGLTYYAGRVYLLSPNAPTLRVFDPATGTVTTLAGEVGGTTGRDGRGLRTGTPADYGHFVSPRYMAHDNSGILYIAETNGNKIREFDTVADTLGTFAGDGTCGHVDGVGTAALVQRARGMTSDGTSLYWVEFNEHTVRQAILVSREVSTLVGVPCSADCSVSSCPGSHADGVGTAAAFSNPFDIVFHYPSNSLFVVDSANYVIRRIQ